MIAQLAGTLLDKNTPPQIVVECHGVGYEVEVPMSTYYNLPETGAAVRLLIHFVVREDAQILFGFGTAHERTAFRQLIKISGVGPRTALGVLSGLSVDELARAVQAQDATRLTKVPGIGKKTAERLLLELKGKMGAGLGSGSASGSQGQNLPAGASNLSDILQALLALGYSEKEASAATQALDPEVGVSEGLRLAMKKLS